MIVFTIITDRYDTLREVKAKRKGVEYICITDNVTIDPKGWRLIDVQSLNPPENLSGQRLQRWVKIIGGLYYFKTTTIYLDGSHEIINDVCALFDNVQADIALKIHPARSTYQEEINACIELQKDDESILNRQMERYTSMKAGRNTGLYETGIIYRKWTNPVIKLCMDWWDQVASNSVRDQVSLPVVLDRNKIPFGTFTQADFLKYIKIHKHN